MRSADSDGPSWSTRRRRRARDIAFLERLRVASLLELEAMQDIHRKGPEWKLVAIARAIARRTP